MTRMVCALVAMLVTGCASMRSTGSGHGTPPEPEDRGAKADWTILMFMNGDNNLEEDALADFEEMASVGSTSRVNIVVQLDRKGQNLPTPNTPSRQLSNWSQTLRFRVTKGMAPLPATAVEDIGEADMGDGAVLKDFITWGERKYPANHYMLVIWDHGQGYRAALDLARVAAHGEAGGRAAQPARRRAVYRSISIDDSNGGDQLYNAEVVDAVAGRGLDVIGFDACLMGMVETAYALRSGAKVMIGSEELEPGSGWQYDDWLARLVAAPTSDPADVGRMVLAAYRKTSTQGPYVDATTTLAVVDLAKAARFADAVSAFADGLRTELPQHTSIIKSARGDCKEYAPGRFIYHVDFCRFAARVEARSQSASLKSLAHAAQAAVHDGVIESYAGTERRGEFGSTGLAIYFPANKRLYDHDPFEEGGYQKDNTHYPVAFVKDERWADFLHDYLARVP